MDKVSIERLPDTKERVGTKRWLEERGEFVQVAYREQMRHLALFEIKEGFSRGNHYHKRKEEIFYVFHGRIRARFVDLDTLDQTECILEKGDKIRIRPNCGHIFYGLEDTLVVEYSPQIYDPEDSYPFDLDHPETVTVARSEGKRSQERKG
jgi:dTDP-4-dehydrorhamnose 3,5-epimerase-like enzyme